MNKPQLALVVEGEIKRLNIKYGKPIKGIPCGFTMDTSLDTYKKYNFYPIVINKPALSENTRYGSARYVWDKASEVVLRVYSTQVLTQEEIDAPKIAMQKREAKEALTATLDEGVEYNEVVYQCHEADIHKFNLGLTLIALTGMPTIACRAMNNSMHELGIVEYNELSTAMAVKYATAQQVYWATIDQEV